MPKSPLLKQSQIKLQKWYWLFLLLLVPFILLYLRSFSRGPKEAHKATTNIVEETRAYKSESPPKLMPLGNTASPTFIRRSEFDMSIYESVSDFVVAGRVISESNGNPLPGAVVTLFKRQLSSEMDSAHPLSRITCDNAGSYEFHFSSPVSGLIAVRRDGYTQTLCPIDLKNPGLLTINFRLKEGRAAVAGQILDSEGKPLPDVRVVPTPASMIVGPQGAVISPESARTDISGWYHIVDLPSGNWKISVTLDGYLKQARTVSLDPEQCERLDFKLASASTLSFVAKNRKGEVLPAVAFSPYGSSTNKFGVITISLPSDANPFKCQVNAEGYNGNEVLVDPKAPPTEVLLDDFDILKGRVLTLSGSPLSGVRVGFSDSRVEAITNDIGEFQLNVISSQVYPISVNKFGFISETLLSFQDKRYPDFLEVKLRPTEGGFFGRVIDENGKPVTRFHVAIRGETSDKLETARMFGKYVDNQNGMFYVTEVPTGRYLVSIAAIPESNSNQNPKRASMSIEIRKGLYFGEVILRLTRQGLRP